MGAIVFDNYVFDSWLNKKSDEILSKVDRATISTEEMMTLILKANTNHFHHMDIEFREEFKKIDEQFKKIDEQFKKVDERFFKVDMRIEKVEERLVRIESQIDDRYEKLQLQIEKVKTETNDRYKWQTGVLITLFVGIYLKLFFG